MILRTKYVLWEKTTELRKIESVIENSVDEIKINEIRVEEIFSIWRLQRRINEDCDERRRWMDNGDDNRSGKLHGNFPDCFR